LGSELPGFSTYENQVIIANESVNDWHYLTSESGPPLELVLLEREAIDYDDHRSLDDYADGRAIEAFIYSSHNRESFLPHLPDEKEVDHAYHEEVNITKVSKRVAQLLNEVGIGAI